MRKLLFIFTLFLLGASNSMGQDRANLKKEIDKIIHYDTNIDLKTTPGMVIGVKYQDSIFFFSYGSVSKEDKKEPDENTIFEIGGLTKAFTASLVSVLVDEGKMDFEKPLNEYLPESNKNPDLEKITIDQLLTHTSRLPRMPMEFGVKEIEDNNPYAHYTNSDLMDFYKKYILIESKKKKRKKKNKDNYLYSHLNYALLENAVVVSQKNSFENVLMKELIHPIGLENTKIELSDEEKNQMASGYNIAGKPVDPWTFQSFKASEGLKSTAKDLIKFAEAHMNVASSNIGNSLEKTHIPLKKTGLNKRVKSGRGWHIISTNKKFYDIVTHPGSTNGHRSYLSFIKETKTAVVILTNSENGIDNLGYRILYMINNNWRKW